MELEQLRDRSILILGFGQEGHSALRFLRASFPGTTVGIADQLREAQLPEATRQLFASSAPLRLHLGPDYFSAISQYDIIVKSPGIPVNTAEYKRARAAGTVFTSPTEVFFSNCAAIIIGVTGTKGKSTTASLIHAILRRGERATHLIGNIGVPALDQLPAIEKGALVVFELSSHQLEGLRQSPRVAVLLNVFPEHLDYYKNFEQYADAKANITRFQRADDILVYDSTNEETCRIAAGSQASKIPCSMEAMPGSRCFVSDGWIVCRSDSGSFDSLESLEKVMPVSEIPLPGRFNQLNVAIAVAVAKHFSTPTIAIQEAIRGFRPLPHRLERVGTFRDATYYDDSIGTIPEATIAALDTFGDEVETLLVGGMDRKLDFAALAHRILSSQIRTLILFPVTGEKIWSAIVRLDPRAAARFQVFPVNGPVDSPENMPVDMMEMAVRLASQHTSPGRICLLSPASPSFGLFRDFRDRGEQFQRLVRALTD